MTDYYDICKMTDEQVRDAILEAHRDNDTHDVEHYSKILLGRINQWKGSMYCKTKGFWNHWTKDSLPESGKNLIVLDTDGNTYYCFRCSCHPNCETLKDCLCGGCLIIEPEFWIYNEGSFVPDGNAIIDFMDLL